MSEFEKGKTDGRATEIDLRPELYRYQDEGCEMADSCLNCPFTQCYYEQYGGKQRWLKKARDREIARLFKSKRKRIRELAQIFGVSDRTIQRALRKVPSELPPPLPVNLSKGVKRGE